MLKVLSFAQRAAVLKSGGDFEAVDRVVCHHRRRAVLDDIATSRECALAIGIAAAGMGDDVGIGGETILIANPPSSLQRSLGEVASRLVAIFTWRLQERVRSELGEERPLYLAGALLAQTQPRGKSSAAAGSSDGYDPNSAHVDRANVSSYDYSAVLYLNTQSDAFEGGDFAFVDEAVDEVVQPRTGRCVLFPSGFEHLHRVGEVISGSRVVLACWFTLTASAGDALLPAHYTMA